MRKVTHEIIVNVETGAYTAKPPIDIHQGDSNTHILLIKLRNSSEGYVSVDSTARAKLFFQRNDSSRVESNAVDIVNPYRGVLSYTLGPAIVNDYGRYTCRLEINGSPTVTFVVTISKTHGYESDPNNHEVTITEEFYNDLSKHIESVRGYGLEVHISPEDREFLDTFNSMTDELNELLNTDFDKEIDESVAHKASEILARAFITLDFKSQMKALKREELVDGKIVRINYPDHDGKSSTIENHSKNTPEYYVCKLLGDGESIEWHRISLFDYSEDVGTLQEQIESIVDKVDVLSRSVSALSVKVDEIESSTMWKNFDGSLVKEEGDEDA